jgi:2-aminoadipate transaminase
MTARFARRLNVMKASEIRELLKITQRPEVISFAGGLPAPELFPIHELKQVAADVLEHEGTKALQYSTTEGHPGLREQIVRRMNRDLGTSYTAAQVLITSGSQQGLDLTGKLFLDEGDEVLCESPTYIGAINAFRAYEPRFVDVPTDEDGMIPEELERCIAAARRPKYIYAIPTFQNPTGRTWTVERRRAMLEVAARHGLVVVEDDPYGQLCFEGTTPPALAAMAKDVPVVYLGTFSKIFCPGMRIGWLAAPPELYEKYALAKQGLDLNTSTLGQYQLLAYLEHFDIDASIARIREVYRRRRAAMLAAIEQEFPAGVTWTRPRGGLFLWVTLPEAVSARDALAQALEQNVAFVPGGSFFPNGGHENTMRLNYSNMPEDRITEGIRRLGAVLRGLCEGATKVDRTAARAR